MHEVEIRSRLGGILASCVCGATHYAEGHTDIAKAATLRWKKNHENTKETH